METDNFYLESEQQIKLIDDILSACPKVGAVYQRYFNGQLQQAMVVALHDSDSAHWSAWVVSGAHLESFEAPGRRAALTESTWVPQGWVLNDRKSQWAPPELLSKLSRTSSELPDDGKAGRSAKSRPAASA